jgi:dienelactone hydrolase
VCMEEKRSLRYICRECRFPGRAYIPLDQDVRGGVLVLHGSEGGGFGTHDRTAALLACHGFTALAYDWCGSYESPVDGLPSKVVDIAIEGPVKALRWLQRHESVRNKPLAIHGFSRGAELAMIIATLSRDSLVARPFWKRCRRRQQLNTPGRGMPSPPPHFPLGPRVELGVGRAKLVWRAR